MLVGGASRRAGLAKKRKKHLLFQKASRRRKRFSAGTICRGHKSSKNDWLAGRVSAFISDQHRHFEDLFEAA